MGPASIAEVVWKVLMEWDISTRWLSIRLACDGPWGCRVRVGGISGLEVGVLIVERRFAEFSGEITHDHLGKCHEPGLGFGVMVRRRWKDPAPSAVPTQDPKTKASLWLKATIGLMQIEAVEFAMKSSTIAPTWRARCQCFRPATYPGEYPR
jgi:hypothetical protein